MKIDDAYNYYLSNDNIVTEKFHSLGSWTGEKLIKKISAEAQSGRVKKKILAQIDNFIVNKKLFSFKDLFKVDAKLKDENPSADPSFVILWSMNLNGDKLARLLLGEPGDDKLNGIAFNNAFVDIANEFDLKMDAEEGDEDPYESIKNNGDNLNNLDGGWVHLAINFQTVKYYSTDLDGADFFNPNYVSSIEASIYFNVTREENLPDYGVKIGNLTWRLERTENMDKPPSVWSKIKSGAKEFRKRS